MTRRMLAIAALFCVTFAACGHYGPPVRSDAGREAPEADPAGTTNRVEETDRDER